MKIDVSLAGSGVTLPGLETNLDSLDELFDWLGEVKGEFLLFTSKRGPVIVNKSNILSIRKCQ